jgi:hypothetical protein
MDELEVASIIFATLDISYNLMANQSRTWNVPSSIQEAAPDTGTGTKTTELAKSQNELQLSFSQTSQPIKF